MWHYQMEMEKKQNDPVKILEFSYTSERKIQRINWEKDFPKAEVSAVALDEKKMAEEDCLENINTYLCRNGYKDCDFLVVRSKYPKIDFEIVRHLFHLVKPGGLALIFGTEFNPSFVNEFFYDEETRKGVVIEYDEANHVTAFIKPKVALEEELSLPQKGNVFFSPDVPPLEGKDFVVITSAVSCGGNFSLFYPQERFEQTLKTISSVREKIPSAKIILVEMSKLSQNRVDRFSEVCDMVILCQKNPEMGEKLNKHIGELSLIREGMKAIPKSMKNFYKMGGRGYLTEDFNIEKFRGDKMTFAMDGQNRYNTKFYHIPSEHMPEFLEIFPLLIHENESSPCIEKSMYFYLPSENVKIVDSIGYEILTACDGKFSKS